MLQAMRDGSKGVVAKIIVGLIILTFALFGIDSIVALGGGQDAPAEVNGEKITELRVAQMVDLQKRRLQSQFGENFQLGDERLRSIAVDGLINEVVLKQAANDAGVTFSDAEIDKLILQSPEFQVGGVFDRNQFDLTLRSAGFTRSSYRELLRTNLMIQQAQNALQATAFSTDSESNVMSLLDLQSRDFSTITFAFADIKSATSVSDEEVSEFYRNNSASYMTEESVAVDYVELKRSDLASNIQIDEDDVMLRYQEMKADNASKKEYRAAHILLTSNDAEAKEALSKALDQINSGADFAELAKELSDDDSSKFAGGDLGFSSLEVFESEFSDALAGLGVGETSGVVETRDGLHIIKLLDERLPEMPSFDSAKGNIESALAEEAAQVAYIESLESLKDDVFSSSSLAEASNSQNLTIKTSDVFTKRGGSGVASSASVVEAAFSETVLNDDANSEVIELADGHAIAMHLNKYNESVVKPLTDVRAQIVEAIKNEKARSKLDDVASQSLEQARDGSITANWETIKDKRRASEGVEASVLNAVFKLPEGGFDLVSASNGDKVLVRVDSVIRPEAESKGDDSNQKVSRSKAFNEYKAYQQFVTEKSDIEKN